MKRYVRSSRIEGQVRAPGSKSLMLRAVAIGLLAEGKQTRIFNPASGEDSEAGLRIAGGLGASIWQEGESVSIVGGFQPRENTIDCGNSGLCLRMFAAIAALRPGEIILTGAKGLLARPAEMLEKPIEDLGGWCRTRRGFPPVRVRGPLRGGRAVIDGSISSQFLTGLLIALPAAAGDSELEVKDLKSRPYVDMTLGLLKKAGVQIERRGYEFFKIKGSQDYELGKYTVEGDWSGAAFLLVAGALAGKVRVSGLDSRSLQGDRKILDVLKSAGARVTASDDAVEVEKDDLKAFEFEAADCPDLFPPLVALACFCRGKSLVTGAARLRHKESDRAAALAEEFGKLGADIQVRGDTMVITGTGLASGIVRSHGDHRMAMALAVAALAASDEVVIQDAQCVAKSYPRFFEDLAAIGGLTHE